MSYLNLPRLHFAGRFQAAPSTVNNDPLHFDNSKFVADYQKYGRGASNGWWNPNGDASWLFIGCKVTAAWTGYDQAADATDVINTCLIGDSDRSAPAKIVDLDPEQQMVSEVWGLQVRICLADGTNLLRANYTPAPFMDIWDRSAGGGGDTGGGAMYQSVLTDLEWGDISASPFLIALKAQAKDGLLSIKFNIDGYNMDPTSPNFTRGRIVGTIGPASAGEPAHFVPGRHFMAAAGPNGNFFAPAGKINFCVAMVDAQAGKIVLDLGNAIPTTVPGGPMVDLGTLALGYPEPPTQGTSAGGPPPVLFSAINYLRRGWYEATAGIVTFPRGRALTESELAAIQQNPLIVCATAATGTTSAAISEASNGTYVRADRLVFRLDPGDTARVRLYATQFGQPYAGARIISVFDPSQLQPGSPLGPAPPVGIPTAAVEFPARVIADNNGFAELAIEVGDPGPVRDYIDGQIYGVRPVLEENLDYGAGYNFDPWEFVSLLVWSGFAEEDPLTWHGSIEPIFQQYANLYPVMKPIVDLKDYESVLANLHILKLAFGLPVGDPNSMPVTRDLSSAKRKAILRWLGKPLKGTPPGPVAAAAMRQASVAEADEPPLRGGKAMAASRRIMLRNKVQ
ncbi:MAG: hypothetical protein QOI05_1312 [Bradyrhizobium sp.]|jgi:hypothetical protein|nr:hypothetical protein [Bradyrhizobium sp.]